MAFKAFTMKPELFIKVVKAVELEAGKWQRWIDRACLENREATLPLRIIPDPDCHLDGEFTLHSHTEVWKDGERFGSASEEVVRDYFSDQSQE